MNDPDNIDQDLWWPTTGFGPALDPYSVIDPDWFPVHGPGV